MRDPDLVLRAQRAAAVLERAWDRWRALHGRGAEPLPPVSSYVGYSLEEPWGQPRVVFGVPAEDAERLAVFLERHECVGAAGMHHPAEAGGRRQDGGPAAQLQRAAAGARPQIPGQATAGPPERYRATGPTTVDARLADRPRADDMNGNGVPGSRAGGANGNGALGGRADLAGPIERSVRAVQAVPPLRPATPVPPAPVTPPAQPGDRQPGRAAVPGYAPPQARAETRSASQAMPGMADDDGLADQAGLRASGGDTAMLAFRPGAEPVSSPGEKPQPGPIADGDQATRRPRSHRHAAGDAVQHAARQKRAGAAAEGAVVPLTKPAAAPQAPIRGRDGRDSRDGRDYRGPSTMAGDLAGWASGELPGQARRQPPPWTVAGRPDLDDAEPASDDTRRDNAI